MLKHIGKKPTQIYNTDMIKLKEKLLSQEAKKQKSGSLS